MYFKFLLLRCIGNNHLTFDCHNKQKTYLVFFPFAISYYLSILMNFEVTTDVGSSVI